MSFCGDATMIGPRRVTGTGGSSGGDADWECTIELATVERCCYDFAHGIAEPEWAVLSWAALWGLQWAPHKWHPTRDCWRSPQSWEQKISWWQQESLSYKQEVRHGVCVMIRTW